MNGTNACAGTHAASEPVAEVSGRSTAELLERFRRVRAWSLRLADPLPREAYRIQSMPDVSPPWWNLGHTSWFFAKNVLEPLDGYRFDNPGLEFALNSYYETHGERLERSRRGQVSRPTTEQILAFRRQVDERTEALLERAGEGLDPSIAFLVETGLQHEQQHQELMVTEIKHILWSDPPELRQAYGRGLPAEANDRVELSWCAGPQGVCTIGSADGTASGGEPFCWDNEQPRHRVYLEPYEIANRLVTQREFLEFVEAGGYDDPLLWLSNGWAWVKAGNRSPLYWAGRADGVDQRAWTLQGSRVLDPDEPVCHVSFYEADAFATWKGRTDERFRGARLPTEAEWEAAADRLGFDPAGGNLLEDECHHPRAAARAGAGDGWSQAAGDLWEWTQSHYEPYPGYRPFAGALMEYNGKFMDNQRVLRGGSCATPRDHVRAAYRNFWPAETQFQFTGIRLARSVTG